MKPPGGQALIEGLSVLALFALFLLALTFVFAQGLSGQTASLQAWQMAQRCALFQSACSQDPNAMSSSSLGQGLRASQVSMQFDQPIVQVSARSMTGQLFGSLAQASMNAAAGVFGLPESRRFLRATAQSEPLHAQAYRAQFGLQDQESLKAQSRVALIAEDWSSSSQSLTLRRIQQGQNPSNVVSSVNDAGYWPTLRVLMPAFEAISLESGSRALRNEFHQVTRLTPFPGTQAQPSQTGLRSFVGEP
jgi:hypothetical protein